MASDRITVRLPQSLTERLRKRSQAMGATESEMIREALEGFLQRSRQKRSAFELAEEAGIIGVVRNARKDLSTNRRHFQGFGKRR